MRLTTSHTFGTGSAAEVFLYRFFSPIFSHIKKNMIFFCCVMFSSLISQIARFPQTILASTCTFLRVAIATACDENNYLRFLSPDLIRTQNNLFASAWNGQQKK